MTGPGLPAPMARLSTSRIGVTSAAVPVKNASSDRYSSSRVIRSSRTGIPSSRASVRMVSRVMPARMDPDSGGVIRQPRLTTNRFSPLPSLTYPWVSSRIASS